MANFKSRLIFNKISTLLVQLDDMRMPRALIYGLEELLHGIDGSLCFAFNLWRGISRLPALRNF